MISPKPLIIRKVKTKRITQLRHLENNKRDGLHVNSKQFQMDSEFYRFIDTRPKWIIPLVVCYASGV